MPVIIGNRRYVHEGTIIGDFSMSDKSNYLDTRKGIIKGKISMLAGNDTVFGGTLSEVIDGGVGKDRIDSGLGNDKLIGGEGKDTLTGGAGNDTFVFSSSPLAANADAIVDFNSAEDTFQLKQTFFAGLTAKGSLKSNALHFGLKAADAKDRIIYDQASGNLYYDPDGTGAQSQIKIAVLTNKATVTLSDFKVV